MSQRLEPRFDPSSPKMRVACAIAAVALTLATLDFIDALSHGYGNSAPSIAQGKVLVVAKR